MMNIILSSDIESKKMEDYSVAKSNEFITRAKYDLTVMEQRLLACMISTLDSRPKEFRDSNDDILSGKFSIDSFCELCHIEKRGSIKYLKEVIQTLRSRSWWKETPEGNYKLMAWIDTADIDPKSGEIRFVFSSCMKPYLLNLEKDFTSYKLPMVLRFSSRYTNIVYDLIQAKYGQAFKVAGDLCISVDEMRKKIQVEYFDKKTNTKKIAYLNATFKDIRTKILDPAIEEINKFTDIMVEVEYIRKGRKVDTIRFCYRSKTSEELREISLLRGDLKKGCLFYDRKNGSK